MFDSQIKVFQGRNGLTALENDWCRLTYLSNNADFYQYFQWYDSLLSTIFKDNNEEIYFFVYYRDNLVASIFPLMKCQKKILGIKYNVLELPDHPHIDLSDFIYSQEVDPAESLGALLRYLGKTREIDWDLINLPHLVEVSPTIQAFTQLRHKFHANVEEIGRSDYFSKQAYEKLLKTFSKNFRHNLSKARNKLSRLDNVSFIRCENGAKLNQAFLKFIEVEASGWKGDGGTGTAIRLHHDLTEFYRNLSRNFSRIGQCQINLLLVDDVCIAGQFCLLANNRCSILKIGYHSKYAKLAPGNMLLENTLKDSFSNQSIFQVSLVTGTKWHADWRPTSYKVYKYTIYNQTIKGEFVFLLIKCRQLIKLIYYRILYVTKTMNHR